MLYVLSSAFCLIAHSRQDLPEQHQTMLSASPGVSYIIPSPFASLELLLVPACSQSQSLLQMAALGETLTTGCSGSPGYIYQLDC